MHVGSRGAVGVGGDVCFVTLFVGVVDGGVFLLLESDGEAEIAVFLGEGGVVVCQHGGDGGFAGGAVVHVDVVRVGGFAFFAHGGVSCSGVGGSPGDFFGSNFWEQLNGIK